MEAPKLAKELNVDRDQVTFSYQAETRDVYHLYYNFTDTQLIEAIAAEMDIWSGRWDYYLYGDEHFKYWYESKSSVTLDTIMVITELVLVLFKIR